MSTKNPVWIPLLAVLLVAFGFAIGWTTGFQSAMKAITGPSGPKTYKNRVDENEVSRVVEKAMSLELRPTLGAESLAIYWEEGSQAQKNLVDWWAEARKTNLAAKLDNVEFEYEIDIGVTTLYEGGYALVNVIEQMPFLDLDIDEFGRSIYLRKKGTEWKIYRTSQLPPLDYYKP